MADNSAIARACQKSSSVGLPCKTAAVCFFVFAVFSSAGAQLSVKPNEAVARLQHYQFRGFVLKKTFATAWCANPQCDVVVTNHHAAELLGPHATIKGVRVTEVVSATSEHDADARMMPTAAGPRKLAYIRDIALLTLKEPLARKGMQAVPLYAGQLYSGQRVTAIGFPDGLLVSVAGRFAEECDEGILRFDMEHDIGHGFSGGLVLDEQGRAVGLLFLAGLERRSAYAVPAWSIADFIQKAKPQLYAALFKGELHRGEVHRRDQQDPEQPAMADFEKTFPSSAPGFSPGPALPDTYLLPDAAPADTPTAPSKESSAVLALRQSAQTMSLQMGNFVARQTLLFSDGRAWQHELQVVEGRQRFRSPDGRQDRVELPIPGHGPVPGSEWADLVKTIGFNSSLTLQFEGDVTVGNQTLKLFRYQARAGDQICRLRVARTFRRAWEGSLPCSGAIWTDEQFRVLRITQDMTPPPETGLAEFRIVVLYGWWGRRLVPAAMYLRASHADGKTFASRATFDNYRAFAARTRILLGAHKDDAHTQALAAVPETQ